jgi:hypothetical protein
MKTIIFHLHGILKAVLSKIYQKKEQPCQSPITCNIQVLTERYCIPRKDFVRFKLALFAVGMIPRNFIAVNMSLITNPQTFLASTKYKHKRAEYLL